MSKFVMSVDKKENLGVVLSNTEVEKYTASYSGNAFFMKKNYNCCLSSLVCSIKVLVITSLIEIF